MTNKLPENHTRTPLITPVPKNLSKEEMLARLATVVDQLEKTVTLNHYQCHNKKNPKKINAQLYKNITDEIQHFHKLLTDFQQLIIKNKESSLKTKNRLAHPSKDL